MHTEWNIYPFPHRNPGDDRQALEAFIRAAGITITYSTGAIDALGAEDDDCFHLDYEERRIWIADWNRDDAEHEDIEYDLTGSLVQAFENLVHAHFDAIGPNEEQVPLHQGAADPAGPVGAAAGTVVAEAWRQREAGEHVGPGAVGRAIALTVGQTLLAAEHHQAEQDDAAKYATAHQDFVAEPFTPYPVPAAALLKWTATE
jgi:hypothetical protein